VTDFVGGCGLSATEPLVHNPDASRNARGKEVGLYAYDLNLMHEALYRPIPNDSGGVKKRVIRLSPWFDPQTGYFVLGVFSAIHADTGDLKLIEGLPKRNCELAANPVVDNTRIVYRENELSWRDQGMFYVNRNTLKVERHLRLPGGKRDVVIDGALGNLVLAPHS